MKNFRNGINLSSLNPYVNQMRRSGLDSAAADGIALLRKNKDIVIVLTNDSLTEDVEVVLTPGSGGDSAPGLIRDNVKFKGLVNGVEQTAASITSVSRVKAVSIAEFLFTVKEDSLGLTGIRIATNRDEQITTGSLMFEKRVPMDRPDEVDILLSVYIDENTVNNKIVTIRESFALSKNIRTSIVLPRATSAGPTVTIVTLFAGIYESSDSKLENFIVNNPDLLNASNRSMNKTIENKVKSYEGVSDALVLADNNTALLAERINKATEEFVDSFKKVPAQ